MAGSNVYIGIDPGASGGLAAVGAHDEDAPIVSMPATERDIWIWFEGFQLMARNGLIVRAVIEHNTGYVGGAGNTGSSMFKFGRNTGLLVMALTAADIPFEQITPTVWQRALGIPTRKKGRAKESKGQFKTRLKQVAQRLFPTENITLATADALLIAEFCRRKHEGLLS